MYICVCVPTPICIHIYAVSKYLIAKISATYICTCMKGKFYAYYCEKIKSTLRFKIFLTILPYFTYIQNIVSTEQGRYWYTYVQHMYSIYVVYVL